MKNELYKVKTASLDANLGDEEPGLYHVILHHDDYTAREFVVEVLEKFFHMDRRRAVELMQVARDQGRAICGLFTKDVAATKVTHVQDHATRKEFPLVCTMESVC